MTDRERRESERFDLTRVRLLLPSASGDDDLALENVSTGGCRVTCGSTLPVGAEIEVQLVAPWGQRPVRARVMRLERVNGTTGMAFQWIDLSPRWANQLVVACSSESQVEPVEPEAAGTEDLAIEAMPLASQSPAELADAPQPAAAVHEVGSMFDVPGGSVAPSAAASAQQEIENLRVLLAASAEEGARLEDENVRLQMENTRLLGLGRREKELEERIQSLCAELEQADELVHKSESVANSALRRLETIEAEWARSEYSVAAADDSDPDKAAESLPSEDAVPALGRPVGGRATRRRSPAPTFAAPGLQAAGLEVDVTPEDPTDLEAAAPADMFEWREDAAADKQHETVPMFDSSESQEDGPAETRSSKGTPLEAARLLAAANSFEPASRSGPGGGQTEPSLTVSKAARSRILSRDEALSEQEIFGHLENGALIEVTERFGRLEPVSRTDILVSDWLRELHTLTELRTVSAGRLEDEELLRVLRLFFDRGLINLLT